MIKAIDLHTCISEANCNWIYNHIETFKSVIGERFPTSMDGKFIFHFKQAGYWEVYIRETACIESLTAFFEELIK